MENITRFMLSYKKVYSSRQGWVSIKKINDDCTFETKDDNCVYQMDGRVSCDDTHPRIFLSIKHMQEYFNKIKDRLVFLEWLKDKGYYKEYYYSSEVANQRWDNKKLYKDRGDLEELMNNEHDPKNFISDSFVLSRSKDGVPFWRKVIAEWREEVNKFSDDDIEFGKF